MTINGSPHMDQDPVEKIILKSMNEGVITLDCNGNIFSANPSALRILGIGNLDILGKNFRQLWANDPDNRPFLAFFEKVVENDSHSLHEEVTFKRFDGQKVDLSIAGSFLDFDTCEPGNETLVVVFRDVTTLKSLERARMRAVNHLSHELKTPLAIIQASVELLMGKDHFPESSMKSLARIKRNVGRLTNIQDIVQEILNPVDFHPRAFPVADFVDQLLDKLRTESSFRAVPVKTQFEDIEQNSLDPRILEVIVSTLVKNAIENTPDEGEIIVSVSSSSPGILLQVQDFGVGIPISDQEFIFEAFHNTQATEDYSTKEPFQFNSGGKGLELLRLKIWSETCFFKIWFESQRCRFIPTNVDVCPGRISDCAHIRQAKECRTSGGSVFSVLFNRK